MPTTVISTNQTSAGILYDITAAEDTYILLPGVSAVATSVVFYSASATHTSLLLAGTVVSSAYVALLIYGSDANVTVAETGLVVGNINIPGFYAVGLQGANNRLTNHGQILTTNDTGVFMSGTGAAVTNTGLISGGQMGVQFGLSNSVLTNSGTISANYGNVAFGVSFDIAATGSLDNSGQITAQGAAGSAGVRVESDGMVIHNTGGISGTGNVGVLMTANAINLSLYNSGTISGTVASLDFDGLSSSVTNRGTLIGNVFLTASSDVFDTVGGTVYGTVFGGNGGDTYIVSSTSIDIYEALNEGSDTIVSTVSYDLTSRINVESLILQGDAQDGIGNALGNSVSGNLLANHLSGAEGADQLLGFGGDDTLDGGTDADLVFGGTGGDQMLGRAGADVMHGEDGEDRLLSGVGNDTVLGGEGDDTLIGGLGRDSMTGGTEADVFVFRNVADSGNTVQTRDIITDFEAGLDVLDLAIVDAVAGVAGNQAFAFLGTGAFTGAAGQLRYYLSGNLLIVEGTVNADLVADFSIRLNFETGLAVDDLIL